MASRRDVRRRISPRRARTHRELGLLLVELGVGPVLGLGAERDAAADLERRARRTLARAARALLLVRLAAAAAHLRAPSTVAATTKQTPCGQAHSVRHAVFDSRDGGGQNAVSWVVSGRDASRAGEAGAPPFCS